MKILRTHFLVPKVKATRFLRVDCRSPASELPGIHILEGLTITLLNLTLQFGAGHLQTTDTPLNYGNKHVGKYVRSYIHVGYNNIRKILKVCIYRTH
jgi:hypothetical protein